MDLKISELTAGTITSNDWIPIERSGTDNYRLNLETAITSKALSSSGGTVTGNVAVTGTLTLGTTTSQITGGAGNMTITAGTGASRTITVQTTTAGGTATNVIVFNADQTITKGDYGSSYQNVKVYNTISNDGGFGIMGFCSDDDVFGSGVALGSNGFGVILDATQSLSWTDGASVIDLSDLILSRDDAGVLQLGSDHATTATAQTFKAHDVTTGTGSSLTIAGGKGSSSGGQVILATSTTNGTPSARLTCNANGTSVFSGTFGYGSGAGGAVTQTGSRTDPVTLNKSSGAITLVSAAGSTTPRSFTVTNSTVSATDVILLSQKSGTDKYILAVTTVAAGSFEITAYTMSGTTVESPVINFAVVKGSTS